jgi:asparagine synthase (glutamine-hydrolysing)
MCGISGFIDTSHRQGDKVLQELVLRMANALRHRGPDDVGTWTDATLGIALGHRRLSILDLSPLGHQPMHSACGRYVTSFNGEIYNFKALRQELEILGYRFRGHSDTEVMLSCISQWGLESAVTRFNGMFAIAVWDREERLLHLVRDRLGEKPLYYGWAGKTFLFASELKGIRAHPQFHGAVDRGAVALFMRHTYIPAPYSIYTGISKVVPGTIVTIAPDPTVATQVHPYWSLAAAAEQGMTNPFRGTATEAITCLDELLRDAVKLRAQADVPLGAFLSGGVDSSTIVALMQAQSARPVQTFSIGFHEAAYNEAHHAKAVAEHLGTAHTELYVSPAEAMQVIPRLPSLYDEPFSDSSQIPTYLVSELTRRHVTVALSGDGGDELFGGYDRYFWAANLWGKIDAVPFPIRSLAARGLTMLSPKTWTALYRGMASALPKGLRLHNPGDKPHKLAEILTAESVESLYLDIVSHWKSPTPIVLGSAEPPTTLTDHAMWVRSPNAFDRMMFLDALSYLPDDILVKVDRASMAVSLEARVPLLDHRVVEFAWQLPLSMKVREGQGKWILRQVLNRYVPASFQERPKMGFGVPIDSWLSGPLKEWAESLLDEKRILEQGIFNPDPIRQQWNEHLAGTCNWHYYLWDVLMFQAWLDEERRGREVESHSCMEQDICTSPKAS